MDDVTVGRRERRRRKGGRKMEADEQAHEFQKTIENVEFSIKPQVTQSLGKLMRRDTYIVLHSKNDVDAANGDDLNQESSENGSNESKNFTYSLEKNSEASAGDTYNVDKSSGKNEILPIPAPRKRQSTYLEPEKVSSDTDRDITEIDLDDFRDRSSQSDIKSKQTSNSSRSAKLGLDLDSPKSELIVAPVPKPRRSVKKFHKPDSNSDSPKNKPLQSPNDSLNSKFEDKENVKSELKEDSKAEKQSETQLNSNQLPLIANLQTELESDEGEKKSKKQKKLIDELFDLKGRQNKSRTLSSLIKLEKKKIPKISAILKDLKEEEGKECKADNIEEYKVDFEIDSPHYTESSENGQIYVQSKNGFRLMEKDDILRNGNQRRENDENGRMLENSTVKTAILFQKYWSRSMIYFHGVLAGFGFSHAATVTAIMFHYNYEPQGFIDIYSCLSLKIHYAFYILTALCIISCFDSSAARCAYTVLLTFSFRVDIGHMNRRHWQTAWKYPSMWVILSIYLVSFVLTFCNQMTEARFDAFQTSNKTELWNTESASDIQISLLQWYHTIWARDLLVLFAWLMISLTKFSDFLNSHISNMIKYTETKEAERDFHHIGPKADYL